MVLRRTNIRSLKEVIQDVLKENKLDKGLKEQELMRQWSTITGKMVANSTKNIYIRNRVLYVYIQSAVIRNELSMIKEGLLEQLNAPFEDALIDEIVIR